MTSLSLSPWKTDLLPKCIRFSGTKYSCYCPFSEHAPFRTDSHPPTTPPARDSPATPLSRPAAPSLAPLARPARAMAANSAPAADTLRAFPASLCHCRYHHYCCRRRVSRLVRRRGRVFENGFSGAFSGGGLGWLWR